MKINAPLRWFVSLTALVLMVIAIVMPMRFQILSPRLGMPVVLKPQASFTVELKTSVPFVLPALELNLLSRNQSVLLQPVKIDKGVLIHSIRVQLPPELAAGQYDLQLTSEKQRYTYPNSVYLVDRFPEEISIVQLADLPVLGGAGKGDALFQQIIDEINIINPHVVLLTGDLAYGGSWDQYSRLLKAMQGFDMPVIAVPGNHEYEGWGAYLKLLGQPYHSVDYGNYRFISLNSGHGKDQLTQSQYAWLRRQLQRSKPETVPLIQIHHPLHHKPGLRGYLQVHVQDVVELVRQYRIPIVLSGHWHGDAVYDSQGQERTDTWQFKGAPYVVTTTAGADLRKDYSNSPLHYGYRIVRLKQHQLLNYTYDYDGDGQRDASSSIPTGKLRVKYINPELAIVSNQLNEFIPRAKIKFIIPGTNTKLKPNKGRLLRATLLQDRVEYEVLLDLTPNSEITIEMISNLH